MLKEIAHVRKNVTVCCLLVARQLSQAVINVIRLITMVIVLTKCVQTVIFF